MKLAFWVVLMLFAWGCAHRPPADEPLAGPVPRPIEAVFDTQTGEWSVATGEPTMEFPPSVPMVSIVRGERVNGMVLDPATPAWDKSVKRFPGYVKSKVKVPYIVQMEVSEHWIVTLSEFWIQNDAIVSGQRVEIPYEISVDPPGPTRAPPVLGFPGSTLER